MKLPGKRILVTGASSGIGAELARKLAPAGADLVLSARRVPELEALRAELLVHGGKVEVIPGDLSTTAGADALAAAVGAVDVLVNNAGVDLVGRPWKEGFADKGEKLLAVNLISPLRLTNKLLGPMVQKGQGAVVFMASVSAWAPFPGSTYYAASKAGLAMAAESLRIDLNGTGVVPLCVYAGPIETAMLLKTRDNAAMKKFFGRLPTGKPDILAAKIVRALEGGEQVIVYPEVYRAGRMFDGVMRWATRRMAPKAKVQR